MPAGSTSVSVTDAASDGPPLPTLIMYVTFDPASAAEGALFATLRSALVEIVVAGAVDELLPGVASGVGEVTFAVLLTCVPFAVDGDVCTTSVNVPDAPDASDAMLHETVAPVVQLNVGPLF